MNVVLLLAPEAVRRGHEVLLHVELVRVNDRMLTWSGSYHPLRCDVLRPST